MALINTSTNIGNVTYIARETLSVNTTNSPSTIRLTIDAQVPADVTKIEGTLPGNISLTSASELYITNTSTTTPLIVKLNGEQFDLLLNGGASRITTVGNKIQVGTGTGAIGQTVSTIVGGKDVGWMPFVAVENPIGSIDPFMIYANINGNRLNSAGVAPTGFRTLADCGTDAIKGRFFEQDETTSTIYFAYGTGGYPPPLNAKIYIPNIILTSVGTPSYTVGNRSILNPGGGNVNFQWTAISNRFQSTFSSVRDMTFVYSNIPSGWTTSTIRGSIYIDHSITNFDAYVAAGGASGGISYSHPSGSVYIRNFAIIGQGGITNTLLNSNNSDIQDVYLITFNRTVTFTGHFISGNDGEMSRKKIKNIYSMGQTLSFTNNGNTVFENIYISDRVNDTNVTTLSSNGINIGAGNSYCVLNNIIMMGALPYGSLINFASGSRNIAMIDVNANLQNHGAVGLIIDRSSAGRYWLYNLNITNTRVANNTISNGFPNSRAIPPVRVLKSEGNSTSMSSGVQAMLVRTGSASALTDINPNASADIELLHVSRTSTASVGHLTLYFGSESIKPIKNYTIVSGVKNTDFRFNGSAITFLTTNAEIIFESIYPALGITSMASAVVPAYSGYTAEFQIRNNRPDSKYSGTWTTLNTANIRSAFASLSNYDQYDGIQMKLRIIPTTINTTVSRIDISSVGVNDSFTPKYIGYVETNAVAMLAGTSIGIFDTDSTPKMINYYVSTGASQYMEIPHGFKTDLNYTAKGRKAGYKEVIVNGSLWITGDNIPLTVIPAYPCTNASVAGVTIDGVNKTIVSTVSIQQTYQHAQWWSTNPENMGYDIPITSDDGNTYTLATGWTLTMSSYPSDKTIEGGKIILSTPGTNNLSLSGTSIEFTVAGDYTLTGTYIGTIPFINTSGGNVGVILTESSKDLSYTNVGPNITVTPYIVTANVSVTNIVAGSRLYIRNMTAGVDTYNNVPGTSYNSTYTDGTTYTNGDVVRIRLEKPDMLSYELFTIATSAGFSVLADQSEDSIYVDNGVDGSTVTKFTADYVNDEIDLSVSANFTSMEAYAFYKYQCSTALGIAQFAGGVTAVDAGNYRINTAIVSIKFDNTTTTTQRQTDTARIYRDDEVYPVKDPTTSGYGIDINWKNVVYVVSVAGSPVVTGSVADVANALNPNLQKINRNVIKSSKLIPANETF